MKFFRLRNRRNAEHPWTDTELDLYFEPRPDDAVWKPVTWDNAKAIQGGFTEICRGAQLDKFHNIKELPLEAGEIIAGVSFPRFRGHYPKGGYDVPNAKTEYRKTSAPGVLPGVQGGCSSARLG
jgi:hypothetical protein